AWRRPRRRVRPAGEEKRQRFAEATPMDSTQPSEARTTRRALSARQEAETIAAIQDPWGRVALRSAFHLRRYSVVYGLTVLAAIALLLMPTVAQTGQSDLAGAAGQSNGGAYGGPSSGAGGGAAA